MKKLLLVVFSLFFLSCNSSTVQDARDAIDDPERRTIDYARLGTNAFVNDSQFGTVAEQFAEVRNTLRIQHVRVLMLWSDAVQSGPGADRNFGFYDKIIDALPAGMDALIVLSGLPRWMTNPGNWTDGNPRQTFVEEWVRPVVRRYGGNARVVGFEIWNEPNQLSNSENITLDIVSSPDNYVELLALAHSTVKQFSNKLVVSAATTAINQNFPESLDYNRGLRDAGAQAFLDVWAIHYYGKQYENVVRSGGVADFLSSISAPIWVTESGAQGVNSQLAYAEQTWPFLIDEIPGISRIYQYQFTEASSAESTYGMRNPSASMPVSDLYVHLRDRP